MPEQLETWEEMKKYVYFSAVFSSVRAVAFTAVMFGIIVSLRPIPRWTIILAVLACTVLEACFLGYLLRKTREFARRFDGSRSRAATKRRVHRWMVTFALGYLSREIGSAAMTTGAVLLVLSPFYGPFPAIIDFVFFGIGAGFWFFTPYVSSFMRRNLGLFAGNV